MLALRDDAHCSYSKTSGCTADAAARTTSQQPARAAKLTQPLNLYIYVALNVAQQTHKQTIRTADSHVRVFALRGNGKVYPRTGRECTEGD